MIQTAITGHRPEKINDFDFVRDALKEAYHFNFVDEVTQGCAAGVDLVSAHVAWQNGIPYRAAKPWENHKARMGGSSGFKSSDAEAYDKMIANASEVINVTGEIEFPGNWAYFKRNEWMVDNTSMLIAVWDGSPSGTKHCVEYALKQSRDVWRIDPVTKKRGWYGQQGVPF